MPIDQHAQSFLDLLASLRSETSEDIPQTVEERRADYEALLAGSAPGPDVGMITNQEIPGPDQSIPVRIYRPMADSPKRIMVFFHGGGWCIGSLNTHEELCRRLCISSDSVVVSVDYRLGPESRFPGAVTDCYAALAWVDANRAELVSAQTPIVVAGDSAGGNLAAVVSLMSRDLEGPEIAGQILIYPASDLRMLGAGSLVRNGTGFVLGTESLEWFRENYLLSPEDASDWRASPLLADSHADLPPTLIITAEYDPLLDEGLAYSDKLEASGVDVVYSEYKGMVHVFIQFPGLIPDGFKAIEEIGAWTKALNSV